MSLYGERILKEFLVRIEFAVFAGVVQGDVRISSAVERIDFATLIGIRVDVNAGGALVEFREIEDLMDRLFALNGSRMIVIHDVG